MKYLKISFFLFLLFSTIFLSVLNFIHFKIKQEHFIYYKLSNKIQQLNDTYSLCVGLLTTNPTKINISSCNIIFTKINKITNEIEDKCPYTLFYIKYVHK